MGEEAKRGCSNRIMEILILFLLQTTDKRMVFLEITKVRRCYKMDINLNIDKNNQFIKISIQQLISSSNNKVHRRILTLLNLLAIKILFLKMLKVCTKNRTLALSLLEFLSVTPMIKIKMEITLLSRDLRAKTTPQISNSKDNIKIWGKTPIWEETQMATSRSTSQCLHKSTPMRSRHRLALAPIE